MVPKYQGRRVDSGWGAICGEERVQGDVFEKADFEADRDDLTEVRGGVKVFAAGAEVSKRQVGGAGEFEARRDEGSVEIDDSA